jgi:molybdopterin molybdotransferase
MVLLSGGSSVGTRDYTIEVLNALPDCQILAHGISISPGKPTILARVIDKLIWGLPGQVVSAMVVFRVVVQPFVERIAGLSESGRHAVTIPARLSRNVASAQGRTDFLRVRLLPTGEGYLADPVLGKSGLINTMVLADGLIRIDANAEGLEAGDPVAVMPL